GVIGLALTLTQRVEPVGELADGLALRLQLSEQPAGAALALVTQGTDELVQHLPDREARIFSGVPVGRVLVWAQEANLARAAFQHARVCEAVDARRLRTREHVGLAVGAFVPAVLIEPMQAELRVVVEV